MDVLEPECKAARCPTCKHEITEKTLVDLIED